MLKSMPPFLHRRAHTVKAAMNIFLRIWVEKNEKKLKSNTEKQKDREE